MTKDDRILPLTRRVAGFVVLVLSLAVVILYLFPDRTDTLWSWTIRPTMTPMLMGAGYLAGAYFFFRLYRGTRWHQFTIAFIPITVFVTIMAIATFLHWDRFNHAHISFFAWVGLYVLTPFLIPYLWLRNRRADPGTPEPGDVGVPAPVRQLFGLVGAAEIVVAVWMFFLPEAAIAVWPWTLTPLTARVVAGWSALHGILGVVLTREPRWSAMRIGIQGQLISLVFILLAVVRAWGEFDTTRVGSWIFVLGTIGWVLALGLIYRELDRRRTAVAA